MFDWARGTVLRKMIERKIPGAAYDPWLKGWANAWPLALLKIPSGSRVLDVGTGASIWYPRHFVNLGCEVHVLDKEETHRENQIHFGLAKKMMKDNPDITFHLGLAGQYKGPEKYFHLITCISVIEHIYDEIGPLHQTHPFLHLEALADMVRMLQPGGILALTYDFFLSNAERQRGWDYFADYTILQQMGLRPLSSVGTPKSRTFIYNWEDTLFMAPEGILTFAKKYLRETSIGMLFVKKEGRSQIKFHPHPEIEKVLYVNDVHTEDLSLAEIQKTLHRKSTTIVRNYIQKLEKIIKNSLTE